ncbi:MAG: DnaA ATPase domain-containing protein [Planctomycetota bacterium]
MSQNEPGGRWSDVLSSLRDRIGDDRFCRWIDRTSLLEIGNDGIRLEVPNRFVQTRLEQDFADQLSQIITEVFGECGEISYTISPQAETMQEKPSILPDTSGQSVPKPETAPPKKALPKSPGLQRPRFPLLDFVVADENRLAYLAVRNVITSRKWQYNPLYIYGPTATGKSHLMRGLASGLVHSQPERKIRFQTAAAFSSSYVQAVRENRLDVFRKELYGLDALILDDVQRLEGKRGTMREIMVAFDVLHSQGSLIVVAGSHLPRRFGSFDPALASRLTCGMVAGITSPGFRTRCAILKKHAEKLEACYRAPHAVFEFMAKAFPHTVREMLGGLNRLEAEFKMALMKQKPPVLDVEFARSAVKELLPDRDRAVTMKGLERLVENYFGVVKGALRQPTRRRSITVPRQVCMYLARKHTTLSLSEIGSFFGRSSPGTVKNALRRVARMLETEAATERLVQNIEEELARTSPGAIRPDDGE